jgi:hypothetical protein
MRFPCRVALLSAGLAAAALAQETKSVAWGPRDAEIEAMVREVSAANIEASIRKLAGFHTRHTLSATNDPAVGVGAARNWIKAELERASDAAGGRLQVEFYAFKQPPTPPRLPQGAEIVNIVATLPGTQRGAKERVYVVSAHYDSRSLGIMDLDTHAPGANDDASGTAAVASSSLSNVMLRPSLR